MQNLKEKPVIHSMCVIFISVALFSCLLPVAPGDAFGQPYPMSELITKLIWDSATVRLTENRIGDNWPITWVEENIQVTAYGDGDGFNPEYPDLTLGFSRIIGDPPAVRGEDFTSDADTRAGWGPQGIKASGLLSVKGTLYMFVRNFMVPGSGDYTNARLGWSRNAGKNWQWADWYFANTFGCPEFVQFGPDYVGARDEYVYIVSQDNDNAYQFSERIVLARVHEDSIMHRGAYAFYAGADEKGDPFWARRIERRVPVFEDTSGVQRIAVTHNRGLDRFILTTSHRPPGSNATHTPALGIFEAPQPWGPWRTVYYDHDWSGGCRTYHHKFPAKWMSADGRTMWLLFSGLDCDLYTMCLKKAVLVTRQ